MSAPQRKSDHRGCCVGPAVARAPLSIGRAGVASGCQALARPRLAAPRLLPASLFLLIPAEQSGGGATILFDRAALPPAQDAADPTSEPYVPLHRLDWTNLYHPFR